MTRILELEVGENGTLTLPADILGNALPHTRYILETSGARLTLRPATTKAAKTKRKPEKRAEALEQWEAERRKLREALDKVWPEGVSVVDIVSEMRR